MPTAHCQCPSPSQYLLIWQNKKLQGVRQLQAFIGDSDVSCQVYLYQQQLRHLLPFLRDAVGLDNMLVPAHWPEAEGPMSVQVMLWPEEMPDVTLLVLSAGDDLVPSGMVQAHLQSIKSDCQVPFCLSCHSLHDFLMIDNWNAEKLLQETAWFPALGRSLVDRMLCFASS